MYTSDPWGLVFLSVLKMSSTDEEDRWQVQAASWGILLPPLDASCSQTGGNRDVSFVTVSHPGVLCYGCVSIWKEQACPGAVGSKAQMLLIGLSLVPLTPPSRDFVPWASLRGLW